MLKSKWNCSGGKQFSYKCIWIPYLKLVCSRISVQTEFFVTIYICIGPTVYYLFQWSKIPTLV